MNGPANAIAILIALSLAMSPAKARSEPSVHSTQSWLADCASDRPIPRSSCIGYMIGVAHMHAMMEARTGISLWCSPGSVTFDQMRLMFIKAARLHPEALHRPAAIVLELAMSKQFPCEEEGTPPPTAKARPKATPPTPATGSVY